MEGRRLLIIESATESNRRLFRLIPHLTWQGAKAMRACKEAVLQENLSELPNKLLSHKGYAQSEVMRS